MAVSVKEASSLVKEEVGETLESVLGQISLLDLDVSNLNSLLEKYNLISRDVLGLSYENLVDTRKLPPINPTVLFDQKRIGFSDITVLGNIFFPSLPTSNNLEATQIFYLSVGNKLSIVESQLSEHPPGNSENNTFTNASSKFSVKSVSSRDSRGVLKTKDEISRELGIDSFELFTFPDLPQTSFAVYMDFISVNEPMSSISRRLNLPINQIVNKINWFGSVNANSNNFSKMRVNLGLPSIQIRSASFGDDIGVASSKFFDDLLEEMIDQFNFVDGSIPSPSALLNILNVVQQNALEFLAQFSFETIVLTDTFILEKTRKAGVSDKELEFSLKNRKDINFTGADLEANSLLTTVFPPTSNSSDRVALASILQQDSDTPRYTNRALNIPVDRREIVSVAAKKLIAGINARSLILKRADIDNSTIANVMSNVLADLNELQLAYSEYLTPPETVTRKEGTRTTESANITITRVSNLVKTLRISDQITNFPLGFDNNINPDIQEILSSLLVMTTAIETYLNTYRKGQVRDFLAFAISISSVTNILFSDGEPFRNVIVKETPEVTSRLKQSITKNILNDEESIDFYRGVSLQVGELTSVLRGTTEDDPVGKLLDMPLALLDSVLPSQSVVSSFSVDLEGDQEPALRQIRNSFDVLRRTVSSTIRDLNVLSVNFGCAFTDAEFLVSRLSGDSVSNLITALRQN